MHEQAIPDRRSEPITEQSPIQIHASAVALDGRGVLIIGASGSGKSTLALGLIAHGANLIADDQVRLCRQGERITLEHPTGGPALIEARRIGLLDLGTPASGELAFVVDLDQEPEGRLPARQFRDLLGLAVPVILARSVPNLVAVLCSMLRGADLRDPDEPVYRSKQ